MAIAAPVIVQEMSEWVRLGGGNAGIVGNAAHKAGFHRAANEVPPTDYSRSRDPAGPNGPVNWDWACAGDFAHRGNEGLRARHRELLARLMRGEHPMICEFIGKPWVNRPVYYWCRWAGNDTLVQYTGQGHDTWSHISWWRSRADEPAHLWSGQGAGDMDGDTFIKQASNVIIGGIPGGTINMPFSWWLSAIYAHIIGVEGIVRATAHAVTSVHGVDDQAKAQVEAARKNLDDLKATLVESPQSTSSPE